MGTTGQAYFSRIYTVPIDHRIFNLLVFGFHLKVKSCYENLLHFLGICLYLPR